MLTKGNTKLGPLVWAWSLLAGLTCPGRSGLCFRLCYARKGRFIGPSVLARHAHNYEAVAQSPDFAPAMSLDVRRNCAATVRVHVAGDFYDAVYTAKWLAVVRANRRTTFFAYTRSWRGEGSEAVLPLLRELALEPNFRLWLSWDREIGPPPYVDGARTAYLAVSDDDLSPEPADLVFRDKHRTPLKWDGHGTLVCPAEQGIQRKERMTCSKCRLCFGGRAVPRQKEGGPSEAPSRGRPGRVSANGRAGSSVSQKPNIAIDVRFLRNYNRLATDKNRGPGGANHLEIQAASFLGPTPGLRILPECVVQKRLQRDLG